ncbi:MAG: phosphate acyltransferase, partial [Afipia sp.]|nr:phosphate acyltransferase [Afipia sp.]
MKIPVFHDDQHGTAIIVGAAMLNALMLVGKRLDTIKLVCSGAGAAAIACLDTLVGLGVERKNICVVDSKGVIYTGRNESINSEKEAYALTTSLRTLSDAMADADVFLGLSTAGVLSPKMVERMAERPIIFALANPDPEIQPEDAIAVRPEVIIATGRSDYPNQVNNVLCFPFIFRGALDVRATTINDEMKFAALHAIANLARSDSADEPMGAYDQQDSAFGPGYFIPRPFDPRLIAAVAPAVAKAAMDSGVALSPIVDIESYRRSLQEFTYRSGSIMRPIFSAASKRPSRVVFAEGENNRVLRAAQIALDEGLARPVLLGCPDAIAANILKLGLRMRPGNDVDIVSINDESVLRRAAFALKENSRLTKGDIPTKLRKNSTMLAAALVLQGDADALICGAAGGYYIDHLTHLREAFDRKPEKGVLAAMNLLMLPLHTVFICDTYVNENPTAEEIAEIAELAASEIRHFGLPPRIALVSHVSRSDAN